MVEILWLTHCDTVFSFEYISGIQLMALKVLKKKSYRKTQNVTQKTSQELKINS